VAKTSLFRFKGELQPKNLVPEVRAGYSLERPSGSFGIDIEGHEVTIQFMATYESFDELYAETYELALAFFSVGALNLGLPMHLVLNEWEEIPAEGSKGGDSRSPVRGTILHEDPDVVPPLILPDQFTFGLAHGMRWFKQMATNPFLRRAVLDYNFALNHPLQEVPIYLARAIESAEEFFGGEKDLKAELEVSAEVKKVKRIANDARSGLHTRHAAKTKRTRALSREEVLDAAEATRTILNKFHHYLLAISEDASDQDA
jgi:hypothetical protein